LTAVFVILLNYRVSGAGSLIFVFHFRLPEFFLMFHRYIFSPYSLFTSQKVSVVISSISQDITEKYHWNTFFLVKKMEGCHCYFSVKRSVVFALLLTTLTLQSETGSAQWFP